MSKNVTKVLILITIFLQFCESDVQHVLVKGVTLCQNRRFEAVVELWEKEVTSDKKLQELRSSLEGEFTIGGQASELGSIDPYLKIIHTCNLRTLGCRRSSVFTVPKQFINKDYDMKYISLDLDFGKDEEFCE